MQPIYTGTVTAAALGDPNNTHSILLRLVPDGSSVLELGCATGYLTRILVEQKGCTVTGFEINETAAQQARPFLHQLFLGDLENSSDVAQIDGIFDVILIADVLEHLQNPDQALGLLRPYLAPKGRLVVSLPNVAHWSVRRLLLSGNWNLTDRGLMDRTHLRWFTRKTAQNLLRSAGFNIVGRRVSYGFPAHWRFGFGQRVATLAQRRTMPGQFDDLFAIQHIFDCNFAENLTNHRPQ